MVKNGRAAAIDVEEPEHVRLMLEDGREIDCSHVLLCIGMRPNTQGLGLGVRRRRVRRSGHAAGRRSLSHQRPHIYACGDVTGQIMLANTAAMHGRTAAMDAAGLHPDAISYTGVAWCVFTRPEIAKAGISERQARIDGTPVT